MKRQPAKKLLQEEPRPRGLFLPVLWETWSVSGAAGCGAEDSPINHETPSVPAGSTPTPRSAEQFGRAPWLCPAVPSPVWCPPLPLPV